MYRIEVSGGVYEVYSDKEGWVASCYADNPFEDLVKLLNNKDEEIATLNRLIAKHYD